MRKGFFLSVPARLAKVAEDDDGGDPLFEGRLKRPPQDEFPFPFVSIFMPKVSKDDELFERMR